VLHILSSCEFRDCSKPEIWNLRRLTLFWILKIPQDLIPWNTHLLLIPNSYLFIRPSLKPVKACPVLIHLYLTLSPSQALTLLRTPPHPSTTLHPHNESPIISRLLPLQNSLLSLVQNQQDPLFKPLPSIQDLASTLVFGCPREYRAGSAENMRRGEVKRADEGLVFKETKEGEGWWDGGEMVK
jgi:hypothetical protein